MGFSKVSVALPPSPRLTAVVVTVPAGSDVAAVKALVRRYVFAGVGFRVQEASN